MVCSHKPQEAKLKRFLRQNPQVPYFGELWNRKLLTATAWQSYSDLKHASKISNVAVSRIVFEPNCTTFIHFLIYQKAIMNHDSGSIPQRFLGVRSLASHI